MLGRSLLIIWWPLEIQDFIDLCTVANTSIIFFDETCHGYYLHGKTPSGVRIKIYIIRLIDYFKI
jgi:meckelin